MPPYLSVAAKQNKTYPLIFRSCLLEPWTLVSATLVEDTVEDTVKDIAEDSI